jgi:superfamily II RNA helicase
MIEDKLYNLKSFQRQYKAVLIISVCDNIPEINWEHNRIELLSQIDWNNVLGIASVLCQSQNSIHLDAALRIAQTCLTLSTCNETQKRASAYVLECLTNRLAISMSIKRHLLEENYENSYSIQQKIESSRIRFKSSVFINDHLYSLNKFQSEVYKTYKNNDAISISAPTSAGKSYVLCAILLEELMKSTTNIIYIVPTRALISQVESDLSSLFRENEISKNVNLSTVPPLHDEIDLLKSNVFVFTQERLHWFLINNADYPIPIHLLIIDEAHKIEDGNRGILLQQKLEELVACNDNLKVYFSSPFTSNPEILLENVQRQIRKEKVNTQFVAVNQNLIYATQVKRDMQKWQLSLVTPETSYDLGYIRLTDRPNTEFKKVALIARKMALGGSTIIYSNGPGDAERVALLLSNSITDFSQNDKLQELIKLVKQTIHSDYALAEVLKKGIAFHYGNMPLLIRNEIEKLFSEGIIHYLICTSTLLEGVNLPAKSIIIRNPHRGRKYPLNANDFWNLAGRAGRWGKEFSGNIICIEPIKWDIMPNPNKSKQTIVRAIDLIENNGNNFLEYIQNDTPRNKVDLSWESALLLHKIYS